MNESLLAAEYLYILCRAHEDVAQHREMLRTSNGIVMPTGKKYRVTLTISFSPRTWAGNCYTSRGPIKLSD
jgi:hypothetical protein